MKHCIATILCHNNKLTSEMCLLELRRAWGLCATLFLLSSIRLFFFMQQNLIDVLIFPINVFFKQCTTSIIKRLCYFRGIGQVQIQYFECEIWVKSMFKWAWQDRYIHSLWQSICHLTDEIKCLLHPFQRFKSRTRGFIWGWLIPNTQSP